MTLAAARQSLAEGLETLALPEGERILAALLRYLDLLAKWNRTFNLTAVDDQEQAVSVHLLDSLVVLPFLPGGRVLDVGTGAGLPGIALALARPAASFTLLEASAKKCAFLRQCVAELRLGNVAVVQARVERWRDPAGFAAIVSRAFAELGEFIRLSRHLLAPDGRWLAMKGKLPAEEIARAPAWAAIERVVPLQVPGLNAERHLVIAHDRERAIGAKESKKESN